MKTSQRISVIAILCLLIVLADVLLGLSFLSKTNDGTIHANKDMELGGLVENGVRLSLGEAITASDGTKSAKINANVVGEGAEKLSYTWSVGFVNPSSAWANGKNVSDYVVISPDEDNQFSATITMLRRFSEQVIITLTCDQFDVSGSVTVNCYKHVESISVSFDGPTKLAFNLSAGQSEYIDAGVLVHGMYHVDADIVWSEGTRQDDVRIAFGLGNTAPKYSFGDIDLAQAFQRNQISTGTHNIWLYYGKTLLNADADILFDAIVAPTALVFDNDSVIFD